MPFMDLRKEFSDKKKQRDKERLDKEHDDRQGRVQELDVLAKTARNSLNLQRESEAGAMARTVLTDRTARRAQDLQFGENGYYTNQTALAGKQLLVDAERVKNEGYNYQNVMNADGGESVNVYRRGKFLNPAETFDEGDLDKILAPGGPPGQPAAPSPATPQAPFQAGALLGGGGSGGGMIRRADGSTLSLDPNGQITRSPGAQARQALAPPAAPKPSGAPGLPPSTKRKYPAPKPAGNARANLANRDFVPASGKAAGWLGGILKRAGQSAVRGYSENATPYRNF